MWHHLPLSRSPEEIQDVSRLTWSKQDAADKVVVELPLLEQQQQQLLLLLLPGQDRIA